MILKRKIIPQNLIVAAVIALAVLTLIALQTKISMPTLRAQKLKQRIPLVDVFGIKTFNPAHLELDKVKSNFEIKITLDSPVYHPSQQDFRQNLAFDFLKKTPSLMPVNGYISSNFGLRSDPFSQKLKRHNGIDIAAAHGSPVFAPADGYVFTAKSNRSLGNMIEIMHESGLHTRFGHLDKILVTKGDRVVRGQIIGRVGNTGARSRGSHLHYEVRRQNTALDPTNYLERI